ncbi:hypothetical protein BT93_F0669 [Corymbia citriodora subsp. variegata]|nr:hypothetical protein BT93_F0669 [Corymbia citriodora subsp. variegata]
MDLAKLCSLVVLLCALSFVGNRACYAFENMVEKTVLKVGEERWKESLPLQGGSRLYKLEGLKPYTFYEVKISYPASGGMHVLVTVEPEGVVAIRDVKERESIIYNIVCDELLLGIPHKAWPVGILVLLCLVVAFIVPSFLPPFLLAKSHTQQALHEDVSKNS